MQAVPLVLSKKEAAAREAFLANRRTCVGGSDIQHLLGLEFGCERRLFYDKAGITPDFPEFLNSHMRRGILLEPIALREYSAATSRKLLKGRFIRHPKYPFMGSNLDGIIKPSRGRSAGTLECKTPSFRAFRSYKQTQQPAPSYIVQAHYNAFVAGMTWMSIDIFNPDMMETLWFDLEQEKGMADKFPHIVNAFWSKVKAFWAGRLKDNPFDKLERTDKRCATCPWRKDCQQLGETPQVMLAAAADEIKGIDFDVEVDEELAAKALEFNRLNVAANKAAKLAKDAKKEVEDTLGERNAVEIPDKVRVFWKEQIRNEKAKEARRLTVFSLKVVPLSVQTGGSDGEEATAETDDAE